MHVARFVVSPLAAAPGCVLVIVHPVRVMVCALTSLRLSAAVAAMAHSRVLLPANALSRRALDDSLVLLLLLLLQVLSRTWCVACVGGCCTT